jgi:hypothetical protein
LLPLYQEVTELEQRLNAYESTGQVSGKELRFLEKRCDMSITVPSYTREKVQVIEGQAVLAGEGEETRRLVEHGERVQGANVSVHF